MTAYILGIETTCDETAASVFTTELQVLSDVVASQAAIHARFGGVVPEVAARAHLQNLLPVIRQALDDARISMTELSAVAVAYTPGLIGALLVGLTAAKTLAAALDIPLLGVNHLEGHLFACQMHASEPVFPSIGLVVSGGHTNLFVCESATSWKMIGSTVDDAAGEAFDKVAAILGIGYPGGPAIASAAIQGNARRYAFPRALMHDGSFDFSFSGLKTAVLYAVHGQNARQSNRTLTTEEISDIAASFQAAVIDVLVAKTYRALRQYGLRNVCIGGGVAANARLRQAMTEMCHRENCRLFVPPPHLCTDNAAMQAVAIEKWRSGNYDSLDLDAVSGLLRMQAAS